MKRKQQFEAEAIKKQKPESQQCLVPGCCYFAIQPPHLCSAHLKESKEEGGWKWKKSHSLPTLLCLVPSFKPKVAAGLLQLLLDCDEGREAKRALDSNYRVFWDLNSSNRPWNRVIPFVPGLQKFLSQFIEMCPSLLTMKDFEAFAFAFTDQTKAWYPDGFPLLLKVHLLSYSSWVIQDDESSMKTAKICDSAGDCTHTAYMIAYRAGRKQMPLDDLIPEKSKQAAEKELTQLLDLNLLTSDIMRIVIEYAVRESFADLLRE
jgi:hypothetical protein